LVITHQTWYRRPNGATSWQDYLKYFISYGATNICASHALAKALSAPAVVIPNAYRDDQFYLCPDISRDRELVFLGRLVSDKGVALLLSAIAQLKVHNLTPKLTIIGSGPEEEGLRQKCEALGITRQVEFVGPKSGDELTQLLNAHQIMVVPSLWAEPFGIVALEGMACGCVVVGSEQGGLKEAIGVGGVTFANGSVDALARCLFDLLTNPYALKLYREAAPDHLAKHTKRVIAQAYLAILESALK
jgi:glycosyltransferase involved in cell wall biosynthesis